MSVYNITFSPTGGTQKAADALCRAWEEEPRCVRLIERYPAWPALTADDVCIIAMPVFSGRIPSAAADRLRLLHGNGAMAVLMAVYGNRLVEDALVEMEDILTANGFRITAGVEAVAEHSLLRQFAAGRPDADDRAVLLTFGQNIRDKIARKDTRPPHLPGNRPYRTVHGGLKPSVGDTCNHCGTCARACPAGAIPAAHPDTLREDLCISCMRCVAVCPQRARFVAPDALEALAKRLAPVCTERRDNTLYL